MKKPVATSSAPNAIGTYSQAVVAGSTAYLSGQIGLDPVSMEMVNDTFDAEARQVFDNLAAVVDAAGATLAHVAKLTVYLTDLAHFEAVNAVMAELFEAPYPARAAVGVASLPKGARVEVDAIVVIPDV